MITVPPRHSTASGLVKLRPHRLLMGKQCFGTRRSLGTARLGLLALARTCVSHSGQPHTNPGGRRGTHRHSGSPFALSQLRTYKLGISACVHVFLSSLKEERSPWERRQCVPLQGNRDAINITYMMFSCCFEASVHIGCIQLKEFGDKSSPATPSPQSMPQTHPLRVHFRSLYLLYFCDKDTSHTI